MFESLLTFHRPGWISGAEYFGHGVFHRFQLGLLEGPVYPEAWFAGRWERTAIKLILEGHITKESFLQAFGEAIEEAKSTNSWKAHGKND